MLGKCASRGINSVEKGADREQTALTLEVFGAERDSTQKLMCNFSTKWQDSVA
jgi:hypothetical protein